MMDRGDTPLKSPCGKENSMDNSLVASPTSAKGKKNEVVALCSPAPKTPPKAQPDAPATSSATLPQALSPRVAPRRLPVRLSDWTAEDVALWASSSSLPREIVDCLRQHAINGDVLETLTDADLKTMGLRKLASWLALRSQRSELLQILKGTHTIVGLPLSATPLGSPMTSRPQSNAGSISINDRSLCAASPGGMLQRTCSAPRSCGPQLSGARIPQYFCEVPTPTRASTLPARSVSLTRCLASPIKASVTTSSTLSQGYPSHTGLRPLPQKPNFCPPGGSVPRQPARSSSAVKARTQELPVSSTPRASSCVRTRILSTTTVAAVPVVAAAPVSSASVTARATATPVAPGLTVTVRPLSPSSGRVRQAPACRRDRSIDPTDQVVGTPARGSEDHGELLPAADAYDTGAEAGKSLSAAAVQGAN